MEELQSLSLKSLDTKGNKMKKLILLAVVALGLNAQGLTTKLDGKVKTYKCEFKDGKYFLNARKYFKANERLIIEFVDKSKKDEIEQKYNLQGEVYYGNKFIYDQKSKDVALLFKNLSNEKNIKSVQPNWTKVYKKF